MTTLAAITALVDDKLRSLALGDLADPDVRDRAIAQAVVQYSVDEPQDLVEDQAGVVGTVLALPAGWVAPSSRLMAVEYPLDQVPMATLESAAYRTVAGWQILLAEGLSGVAVRLHYTAPHAADASTVPAHHVNAVACWAAAELCRQWATQKGHERDATISAVSANGASQSGDLARRAKEWLAVYRVALGLPDPDKPGAATGLQAAGAQVSWGVQRVRSRFYSYGR